MRILMFAPLTIQVEAAKKLGFHVTSIWHQYSGVNFFQEVIRDVRQLSDVFFEFDLLSDSTWLKQLDEIFKQFPETYIVPGSPDEFLPAYFLTAERFGQMVNTSKTWSYFQNKDQMRSLLAKDPVLSVRSQSLRGHEDLTQFLKRDLPLIVKPACSNGSKDVFLIRTQDETELVANYWRLQGDSFHLVGEEYLDGTQYSVETISISGQHHIIGITEKFPVVFPNCVESGGVFPAQISDELTTEISMITKRFLDLTQLQTGATHTEVIATKSGVKIVESNPRVGGLIPFLIKGAFGVDVFEFLLNALKNPNVMFEPKKQNVAVLGILNFTPGRMLLGVENLEAIKAMPEVVKLNVWARMGEALPYVTENKLRHGYVVVSAKSLTEAMQSLEEIKNKIIPIYGDLI